MFCKNCGAAMNPGAAVCTACGVAAGYGAGFCYNCGSAITPGAAVCLNCGAAVPPAAPNGYAAPQGAPGYAPQGAPGYAPAPGVIPGTYLNGKDKVTMALICFFLGAVGIHNFMMGESKKGVTRIVASLFCGLGGILALIDFIKILTDKYVVDPNALI